MNLGEVVGEAPVPEHVEKFPKTDGPEAAELVAAAIEKKMQGTTFDRLLFGVPVKLWFPVMTAHEVFAITGPGFLAAAISWANGEKETPRVGDKEAKAREALAFLEMCRKLVAAKLHYNEPRKLVFSLETSVALSSKDVEELAFVALSCADLSDGPAFRDPSGSDVDGGAA